MELEWIRDNAWDNVMSAGMEPYCLKHGISHENVGEYNETKWHHE